MSCLETNLWRLWTPYPWAMRVTNIGAHTLPSLRPGISPRPPTPLLKPHGNAKNITGNPWHVAQYRVRSRRRGAKRNRTWKIWRRRERERGFALICNFGCPDDVLLFSSRHLRLGTAAPGSEERTSCLCQRRRTANCGGGGGRREERTEGGRRPTTESVSLSWHDKTEGL